MAGNGGARPGAGRKPSIQTVRTRKDAERIAGLPGETPLDVMAGTMRALWQQANYDGDKAREALEIETAERACAIAKDLAPYLHPRLQSIELDPGPPPEINVRIDVLVLARQIALALTLGDQRLIGSG